MSNNFKTGFIDAFQKHVAAWAFGVICIVIAVAFAATNSIARSSIRAQARAEVGPDLDSLWKFVGAMQLEQVHMKQDQVRNNAKLDAFILANMKVNPALMSAMADMAEEKEAGRLNDSRALDIVRRLAEN